jgi:hypothetical protein
VLQRVLAKRDDLVLRRHPPVSLPGPDLFNVDPVHEMRQRDGVMAPEHQVVTLCEHALKHSFSELILLTDIELAARSADAASVAETARRWGLERAVFYASVLLRRLMGAEVAALRRVRIDPSWLDRAFLRWTMRRRWNGLSALGYLAMAGGVKGKARFVREALAPKEREALRTPSLGGRLRRAMEMVISS